MALNAGAPGASGATRRGRAVGAWTRLGLYAQVGLSFVLVLAVALLAIQVARWEPLRLHLDASRDQRNTLDPATRRLLEQLPRPVEVDVFFRPLAGERAAAGASAQALMLELLELAQSAAPERFSYRVHDLQDVAAVEQRARDLRLREVVNRVVLSSGERRSVLELERDLASISAANPELRAPPRLIQFRGLQALAQALARVSGAERPLVLISQGRGEPLYEGAGQRSLRALVAALAEEDFRVQAWTGSEPIPADTAVLALLGPVQPLAAAEIEALRAYVESGGRLLATSGAIPYEGPGSVPELLAHYGMRATRGLVCLPVLDAASGQLVDGVSECAQLLLDHSALSSAHPATAPLVEARRRIVLPATRSFDRAQAPTGGFLSELVLSPRDSWRDLAEPPLQRFDFAYDPAREAIGSFPLVMSAQFPPPRPAPESAGELAPAESESRVLGALCVDLFTDATFAVNRDFVLNAFNWLARRDYRIGVSVRDPLEGRIDLARSRAMRSATRVAWYGLPLLAVAMGLFVGWRRRR